MYQPFLNSYGDFQAFCRQKKNKTYIAKPDSGCQGKGIFVTKNPKVKALFKFTDFLYSWFSQLEISTYFLQAVFFIGFVL